MSWVYLEYDKSHIVEINMWLYPETPTVGYRERIHVGLNSYQGPFKPSVPPEIRLLAVDGWAVTGERLRGYLDWAVTPNLECIWLSSLKCDEFFNDEFSKVYANAAPKLKTVLINDSRFNDESSIDHVVESGVLSSPYMEQLWMFDVSMKKGMFERICRAVTSRILRRLKIQHVAFDKSGFSSLCELVERNKSTLQSVTISVASLEDFTRVCSILNSAPVLLRLDLQNIDRRIPLDQLSSLIASCTKLKQVGLMYNYREDFIKGNVFQLDFPMLWIHPSLTKFGVEDGHFDYTEDLPAEVDYYHYFRLSRMLMTKRSDTLHGMLLCICPSSPLAGKVHVDIWSLVILALGEFKMYT